MRYLVIVCGLVLCVVLYSCTKSSGDPSPGPPTDAFDKTAMLSSYADELIIPAYQKMQQEITELETAAIAFLDNPGSTSQETVKAAYRDAHLQYERIEAFNFGPAGVALLEVYANFSGGLDYSFTQAGELTGFSIDSSTIENNISTGSYDLTVYSRNNFYSQGFPALNYLLLDPNAIEKCKVNTTGRVKYVKDLLARLKSLIDKVAGDWGTYRSTFTGNTETNVGSPIGNLVNQFAYEMDLLKGPRIGWPFGKQSNAIAFPLKSEAYFAGMSAALAVENIKSLKIAYTNNGNGKGIADYLKSLGKAELNDDVLSRFDKLTASLEAIPDPLSDAFTSQSELIDAAYKEIQQLLTLLKTDVPSALGVQITFMDNDGD